MSRDNFTAATKRDLALRASHHCSRCKISTVGPSDETPTATTNIGKAAHICAASSGPGARRYDRTMTCAQRSHISATSDVCGISAETGAMISGMEVLVQNIEHTLGMARGTWFANLEGGSDLSDLYWRYENSPWFARLAMMEMIRLSCLPCFRRNAKETAPPLACVNRVNRVEVPTFELVDQRLSIEVELDIEGLGPLAGDLSVFISTPKQLEESRAAAKLRADKILEIERANMAH
jgi:hypothetical protein